MILALILALSAAHAGDVGCWTKAGQMKQVAQNVAYSKIIDPQTQLDIYVPTNALPPYKTVVSFHGGCFEWGDKAAEEDMVQIRRFTNAGYAVVSVNYRLVDVKKKKNLFPTSLEDAQDAVRWVRENGAKYDLSTTQIVSFGYSAGATLAAYMGTRPMTGSAFKLDSQATDDPKLSARVAGVIDLFGRTDFEHGRKTEKKYDDGRDCGEVYLGANRTAANEKQFAMASVLTDVDAQAARFLIMHGNQDQDVSIEHSQMLYAKLMSTVPAALKKVSHKFQFFTVDGAAHMFSKPGEMDQAWEKICPFLTDVLGAPTPALTASSQK